MPYSYHIVVQTAGGGPLTGDITFYDSNGAVVAWSSIPGAGANLDPGAVAQSVYWMVSVPGYYSFVGPSSGLAEDTTVKLTKKANGLLAAAVGLVAAVVVVKLLKIKL